MSSLKSYKSRVRILLRVSSRQQLHDDDIPIQRQAAKDYIHKRPGWVLDGEYIEKGVSAYHNRVKDRQVLQQILADAKKREFDVLLAYMSDRIGRQEEYSFYVSRLNELGVEVWTIKDGQLRTESHIDKLLNYIRFWQNEGESRKIGMRVQDTMAELVKEGRFVGGRPPYGYELILSGEISNHGRALHRLRIVPREAYVVRIIYLLYAKGYGYKSIANYLMAKCPPPRLATAWSPGTVRSILTNPIYMGKVAYFRRQQNHEMVTASEINSSLVIVSEKEWNDVRQQRLLRRNKFSKESVLAEDCDIMK